MEIAGAQRGGCGDTAPHRVGQALLVHPHVGPPGSGSGVCVCVCAHVCKDVCVQRGIRFLVVSVLSSLWQEWGCCSGPPGRSCGGHLCLTPTWMRVSEHMAEGEEPLALRLPVCLGISWGSWGLCLCPAWLLTRPVGSRGCGCGIAPALRRPRTPDLVQSVWLLPCPAGNTVCLAGTVRVVCVGNCPQVCHPV